jgi:hypothetical protein
MFRHFLGRYKGDSSNYKEDTALYISTNHSWINKYKNVKSKKYKNLKRRIAGEMYNIVSLYVPLCNYLKLFNNNPRGAEAC